MKKQELQIGDTVKRISGGEHMGVKVGDTFVVARESDDSIFISHNDTNSGWFAKEYFEVTKKKTKVINDYAIY